MATTVTTVELTGQNDDKVAASITMATPEKPKSRIRCQRKMGFCDTGCGCCCCCVCGTTLGFIFLLLVLFLYFYFDIQPATNFTNVQYEAADGTPIHAYLATPKKPIYIENSTRVPAAVIFHAWNGMSEEPVYFADLLAEQGYYAIAPDLFRNVATDGGNIVRNIINVVSAPQERMSADADAALAYLSSMTEVDTTHIISGPGFCFGGSQSLIFASRHEVAATVTCYGTSIRDLADAKSDSWGKIGHGSVLGIYGMLDMAPSPEEASKFKDALKQRGVTHNVSVYPGVGHAFINPEKHRDVNNPTHKQAVDGWSEIVTFLGGVRDNARVAAAARRLSLGLVDEEPVTSMDLEAASSPPPSNHPAVGMDLTSASHEHHAAENSGLGSMKNKILCAFKCALDVLSGTGHFDHGGLPTLGLKQLLASM